MLPSVMKPNNFGNNVIFLHMLDFPFPCVPKINSSIALGRSLTQNRKSSQLNTDKKYQLGRRALYLLSNAMRQLCK